MIPQWRSRQEKNSLSLSGCYRAVHIASEHPELISQAEALLRREVSPNTTFPIAIPGVTP